MPDLERFAKILKFFKIHEVFPSNCVVPLFPIWIAKFFCKIIPNACGGILSLFDSNAKNFIKVDKLKNYLNFYPSGTSLKSFLHLIQLYHLGFKNRNLKKYDYGKKLNLKIYNQEQPPIYKFDKIKTKIIFFSGLNDKLAEPESVEQFKKDNKNLKIKHYLYNNFGHSSVFWGKNNTILKNDLLKEIKSHKKSLFN